MKKTLAAAILLSGALTVSQAAFADRGAIVGTLVKMEGTTVVITNNKGEEKTYEMTEKTKKRGGDAQPGATIELYLAKDGRVQMVELVKK